MDTSKQRQQHLFFCLAFLIYVTLAMVLCTGASPLIDCMLTDSSVFFLIGRGMAAHKIAYLDFFDHKGWYLYFFNYLGALLTPDSTLGLLVVETVFMLCNVYFLYKIALLVFHEKKCCILCALAMMGVCLNYYTWQGGNLAETYGLTFQLAAFYLLAKYCFSDTGNSSGHPPVYMFFHGICAAVMIGIRANMILMWGAVVLVIGLQLLIQKNPACLLKNAAAGACGVLAGLLPMLLYGIFTGSLPEMISQMISFNLEYSKTGASLLSKMTATVSHPLSLLLLAACLLCAVIVCFYRPLSLSQRLLYCCMLGFSIFSVSISGRGYGHYFGYLIPFLMPLVFAAVRMIYTLGKRGAFWKKWGFYAALGSIFLLTLAGNLYTPMRLSPKLAGSRFRYVQTAENFAEVYRENCTENETVLVTNNNTLFYNKLNVLPKIKHFYIPSVSYEEYPDAIDEQAASIISKENDVIILRYADYKNRQVFSGGIRNEEILTTLSENYRLIFEDSHIEMYVK